MVKARCARGATVRVGPFVYDARAFVRRLTRGIRFTIRVVGPSKTLITSRKV